MKELCVGNCANCPVVARRTEAIDHGRETLGKLAEAAISESVENELIGPVFDAAEQLTGGKIGYMTDGGEIKIAESVEEFASVFRSETSNVIDRIESEIDDDQSALEAYVQGCSGPLTMRANRDGMEVTVRVCMNPSAPLGKGPNEPVTVYRQDI